MGKATQFWAFYSRSICKSLVSVAASDSEMQQQQQQPYPILEMEHVEQLD